MEFDLEISWNTALNVHFWIEIPIKILPELDKKTVN